jgi:DNA-binding transcriptional MerR regulator
MELFSINAVSASTGIHPSRLRRWEDLGLITPARVTLGQKSIRVYREQDVRLLKRVKALMDSGIVVGNAFWQAEQEAKEDDNDPICHG